MTGRARRGTLLGAAAIAAAPPALKTARALGLKPPQSLLLSADEVIE